MKHLRETFTEEEWRELLKAKENSKLNWHDYLLSMARPIIMNFPNASLETVKAIREKLDGATS